MPVPGMSSLVHPTHEAAPIFHSKPNTFATLQDLLKSKEKVEKLKANHSKAIAAVRQEMAEAVSASRQQLRR